MSDHYVYTSKGYKAVEPDDEPTGPTMAEMDDFAARFPQSMLVGSPDPVEAYGALFDAYENGEILHCEKCERLWPLEHFVDSYNEQWDECRECRGPEILRCPFPKCGSSCELQDSLGSTTFWVSCTSEACLYSSGAADTAEAAIEEHNALVRAVESHPALAAARQELIAERNALKVRLKTLEVCLAWEAGDISEGIAARSLGLDRVSARGIRLDAINAGKTHAIPEQEAALARAKALVEARQEGRPDA